LAIGGALYFNFAVRANCGALERNALVDFFEIQGAPTRVSVLLTPLAYQNVARQVHDFTDSAIAPLGVKWRSEVKRNVNHPFGRSSRTESWQRSGLAVQPQLGILSKRRPRPRRRDSADSFAAWPNIVLCRARSERGLVRYLLDLCASLASFNNEAPVCSVEK
jgi:hypothetical protein